MPVLTSVVERRVRMAGGEERTDGASRAHGGGGAPAMLRRRRGEHGVERREAKLVVWLMVPGLHCSKRNGPMNSVRSTGFNSEIRPNYGERGGETLEVG